MNNIAVYLASGIGDSYCLRQPFFGWKANRLLFFALEYLRKDIWGHCDFPPAVTAGGVIFGGAWTCIKSAWQTDRRGLLPRWS